MKICWACSGYTAEVSAQGYCAECQKIHKEVTDAHALRNTQRQPHAIVAFEPSTFKAQQRVGCLAFEAEDIDGFSEADWQDALQPNEGCR